MTMANPRPKHRPWDLPHGPVLEESTYLGRRALLRALGITGALSALPLWACAGRDGGDQPGKGDPPGGATQEPPPLPGGEPLPAGGLTRPADAYTSSTEWQPTWEPPGGVDLYPARRNASFNSGRRITPQAKASTWNNFYEFLPGKAGPVHEHTARFEARPWSVEIAGAVEEERTVDLDEIARIAPLEERVYRFRCVERWAMTVPWTGLPMAEFVRWCRPKPEARYMRFLSFLRPEQAPGQHPSGNHAKYPWPYYEALRLDEATNPLTLLVTGVFGHGLPTQHGAPLRVITPWKYGYKSPKSFVRVEFTREQPGTFWNDLQPKEYGFLSNVLPDKPHPRWSQAKERDLATGEWRPTETYNGYGEQVAGLYR
ncbi:MAG: protein-methionine-sulfoxide reductase catalytic subunit MsrP [Planctomycetes bacterium]|jgi:sulfoxide reductase catalytic subunit YedY|nr:protein-methionine-sulfoxide reductase catalytic subunit MsrP [Planctomycetota bacterium]